MAKIFNFYLWELFLENSSKMFNTEYILYIEVKHKMYK